jgi:hypothetical protein
MDKDGSPLKAKFTLNFYHIQEVVRIAKPKMHLPVPSHRHITDNCVRWRGLLREMDRGGMVARITDKA